MGRLSYVFKDIKHNIPSFLTASSHTARLNSIATPHPGLYRANGEIDYLKTATVRKRSIEMHPIIPFQLFQFFTLHPSSSTRLTLSSTNRPVPNHFPSITPIIPSSTVSLILHALPIPTPLPPHSSLLAPTTPNTRSMRLPIHTINVVRTHRPNQTSAFPFSPNTRYAYTYPSTPTSTPNT